MSSPAAADSYRAAPRPDSSLLESCSDSTPIECTFDVPPGSYDVTVLLGSRTEEAQTAVEAEARRLMVDEVQTDAGERVRKTFTVNVREQEGQQNDHGEDRGTPGLTLTFTGAAPAVAGIGLAPAPNESTPQLFLFGDSTVTDQENGPYTGWGQRLPTHFQHGLSVVNHSGSGESTSSFLADERMWAAAAEQLRAGDVVLIQLAHNDKTTTAEQYRANLTELVEGVRESGATPVLVTPIVRHRFDGDQLNDVGLIHTEAAGDLPQHIRDVAAEQDVGLIDLTARTQELVERLGPEESEPLYLIRINGDRTHTSELGASRFADFVAEGLAGLGLVDSRYWQQDEAYFVAPDGSDEASGDRRHPWATIAHAEEMVQPGDTVYLRGGRHVFDAPTRECTSQTDRVDVITLTKSGTADQPIRYAAYGEETPVLDFSEVRDDCRIKGINVSADHLVLEGLEVTGVRQNNSLNNESWGIWVDGSHNVFSRIDAHHNMGAGLFIQDGGGNLVRNSDSHDNYDPYSKSGAGQNADGFGSHTNTPGLPENRFEGNRAWNNSDDGFDFISSSTAVTVTRSWSWHNGYVYGTDTPAASGNGTGFKLGGHGGRYDPDAVPMTVTFSVAFDNRLRGFYANHHPLPPDVFNNTAFDNGSNYDMLGVAEDGSDLNLGTLRNNVSFGDGGLTHVDGVDSASNSWDLDLALTEEDFVSISQDGWDAPRQADGSLPELPNMRPAPGSAVIDAGVDLGFEHLGTAPDLGAFEYDPGAEE